MTRSTLLVLPLLLLGAGFPRAAAQLPPPPTEETVAQARRIFAESGFVVLQDHTVMDLHHDRKADGLVGTVDRVRDVLVLSSEHLESAAFAWGVEGPLRKLKDVRIEVHSGGQVTRYKKSDLRWFEVTEQSNGVVYLDSRLTYTSIPGLQAGDRVRLVKRSRITGEFGLGAYTLGDLSWPVVSAGLEVRLPGDHELIWKSRGSASSLESLAHSTLPDGDHDRYRWQLDNDPAQPAETCGGYLPSVEVVLHVVDGGGGGVPSMVVGRNWATVGAAYAAEIDPVFDPDQELSAYTHRLVEGLKDPREITRRIYADVQRRCRYLGLFEGRGNIVPVPAADVHRLGFGDCKGLGTLLIAMLRTAGIDAHPVLVLADETRTLEPSVPDMAQFNHFIAWADVGDGGWFLDGTEDNMPAGIVPQRDRRSPVLLLRPGHVGLVKIPAEAGAERWTRIMASGELAADGRLRLDLEYARSGEVRGALRDLASYSTDARRDMFFQDFLAPSGHPMSLGAVTMVEQEGDSGPVVLTGELLSKAPLPMAGGEMYLPLRLWDRGPVALGDQVCGREIFLAGRLSLEESWTVRLPVGFQLAEPVDTKLKDGGVEWICRVWQEGADLRLERGYRYLQDTLDESDAPAHDKLIRRIHGLMKGYLVLTRG